METDDTNLAAAYSLLYVVPGAPERVVRSAFKARARELHPDAGGSEAEFKLLEQAFSAIERAGFPNEHPEYVAAAPREQPPTREISCHWCGRRNRIGLKAGAARCGACRRRIYWDQGLTDAVTETWARISEIVGDPPDVAVCAQKANMSKTSIEEAWTVVEQMRDGDESSGAVAAAALVFGQEILERLAAWSSGSTVAPHPVDADADFCCPACGAWFAPTERLSVHYRQWHPDLPVPARGLTEQDLLESQRLADRQRELAEERELDRQRLERENLLRAAARVARQRQVEEEEREARSDPSVTDICQVCGKNFLDGENPRFHMRTWHRDHR